jgi:hypothetical protein
MIRLCPTRTELAETCVLIVLAVGLWLDLLPDAASRLLLPTMTIYFMYLIVTGVRDLRRWLQRRAAAINAR